MRDLGVKAKRPMAAMSVDSGVVTAITEESAETALPAAE